MAHFTHGISHDTAAFNGHRYSPESLSHPLLRDARRKPHLIDSLLRPRLYSPDLPDELETLMKEHVSTMATPGVSQGTLRSRPRWFYANCTIFGLLLGRAFALLSTPTRPPSSLRSLADFPFPRLPLELRLIIYEHYKRDLAQRERYWAVMTHLFVKGLWSGADAEEGARFTTGVVMLASGHAMSRCARHLQGRGTHYVWWSESIAGMEHVWSFWNLRQALLDTKKLPRDNSDYSKVFTAEDPDSRDHHARMTTYVSREVLSVLDWAREHVEASERDCVPQEIVARVLIPLVEKGEARAIWVETGLLPAVFETRFVGEKESELRTAGFLLY